jgi:predicted trehalose synthase
MTDLAQWLVQQRWFASKLRDVSEVNVLETVPLGGDGLEVAFVEARFPAGTHELYQLVRGGPSGPDGLTDPAVGAGLAALLGAGGEVRTERSAITFHWVGGQAPSDVPAVRPIGAEQTNTSLVVDERFVFKVFRRLEPGDNPELELVRFLSAHEFPYIAALEGWYELGGELMDATLGIAQELIADGVDGWETALAEPDRVLERAADLGMVVGAMHAALGSDATDPAFAPEEPSAEALGLLTATIDEDIERAFLDLPEDDERLAPIAGRGAEVRDRLQLLSRIGVGGKVIRDHGDLHLGQTLLTPDRWVILDFEGEPARPLTERRRKRSPLRDVAGMLRSFAYAASAAELQRGLALPEGWEAAVRTRFLDAYMDAVDVNLLPPAIDAVDKLLTIFELEKAVYELRYELNNRPDWVGIPVAGIARLLEDQA